MTLMAITGMGTATIGLLAGGKIGLSLSKAVFDVMTLGMVDIAVTANEYPSQEEGWSSTIAPQLRNVAWKRGTCWLAVGLLQATPYSQVCAFRSIRNAWAQFGRLLGHFSTALCIYSFARSA
jgi:hypothetical protein